MYTRIFFFQRAFVSFRQGGMKVVVMLLLECYLVAPSARRTYVQGE